jgi:hypothetical protein
LKPGLRRERPVTNRIFNSVHLVAQFLFLWSPTSTDSSGRNRVSPLGSLLLLKLLARQTRRVQRAAVANSEASAINRKLHNVCATGQNIFLPSPGYPEPGHSNYRVWCVSRQYCWLGNRDWKSDEATETCPFATALLNASIRRGPCWD